MTQASGKANIKRRLARWAGFPRALLADRSGGALVFSALALPVILGAAALALDVASWYSTKRQVQTVADAAAMAGVHVLAGGGTQAEAETAARTHAQARLGFIDDAKRDVQVTYDDGVASGTGFEAISVATVQRSQTLLSSVFMDDAQTIRANATAANLVNGVGCVLSLNETANSAITGSGTASLAADCGVASNSSSSTAIGLSGSATIDANEILTYGDISAMTENLINGGDPSKTQTNTFRMDDPYADVVPPAPQACHETNKVVNATESLPGDKTWCGGIRLNGTAVGTLLPGVYILHNGNLEVAGSGELDATGPVTIFLTGDTPAQVGRVNFSGTSTVTLEAPDANGHPGGLYAGLYPGILIFQQRDATANSVFSGGTGLNLSGALYLPNTQVSFSGDNSTAPTPGCMQIIADTMTFSGTSSIANTSAACLAQGVRPMGARRVRLVK